MHAINWPDAYTPGITDNFVSNEVILPNLTAQAVWPCLTDTAHWMSYYDNVSDIRFHDSDTSQLRAGSRFRFTTFSFPVEAEVTEFVPPEGGQPGRLAWRGWVEGDASSALDVLHAWLIENLPGGRVRILTQESQNGAPARQLATTLPNPMLNAHQAWLEGLARYARSQQKS